MYDIFNTIGFVIVYGVLSLLAFIIYTLIKRTNWNPWLRTIAFVPFITYWILTYQSKNAIYYYAFEDVTKQEFPKEFEIVQKYQSPYDDFGDYTVFAVFKVDSKTYKKVDAHFKSKLIESRSLHKTPTKVSQYLNAKPSHSIRNSYHYWKDGGMELYGASLSDNKTVIIFRASW